MENKPNWAGWAVGGRSSRGCLGAGNVKQSQFLGEANLPLGIADWGFAVAGARNKPNFPRFGPGTRVACENEANLWARGLPLGIWDWRLGIRGSGSTGCQTNPISYVFGLKTRVAVKTKPIFGHEACHWGFWIGDWGFLGAGAWRVKRSQFVRDGSRRAGPALRDGRGNAGGRE